MENYVYEEDCDVLYVNNNSENVKTRWNMSIGNVVVDIAKDGKVLGVEIYSASNFFGFTPKQLSKLKLAKIKVMKLGEVYTFGVIVGTAVEKYNFQITIENKHNPSLQRLVA